MSTKKYPNGFIKSLKKPLEGLTLAFYLLQILVSVLFPISEGILASIISNQDRFGAFHLTLIFFAIIHLIIVLILLTIEKPLPEFLLEFDKKEDQIKQKEDQIREQIKEINFYGDYSKISIESLLAIELSLIKINEKIIEQKEKIAISDICEIILDPWITARSNIFNFVDGNAMYNIAVCSLKTENNIKLDFRKHDDRIRVTNRQWVQLPLYKRHVYECFDTRQTVFSNEIEENIKTENKDYYRSIIAEPIKQNQKVIGVFVITSSQANQFDDTIHTIIVRVITLLLEIGYFNIKEVNRNDNK